MKRIVFVSFFLLLMLFIGSVSCLVPHSTLPSPEIGQVSHSDKQRVASPVLLSDIDTLVAGNNTFALDMYQNLEGSDNLFFSPYSISLSLAMTYAGARGTTEQQMAKTLHFTLPQEKLHPVFNTLDLELAKRGIGAKGKDDEGFRLNIVNAIWGQEDYHFLQSYLNTLAVNYGTDVKFIDFWRDQDGSREIINNWVSDQTEGRIKDLITFLYPETTLILTNAIYFNAAWQNAFPKEATNVGPFYLPGGTEVRVPMMRQTHQLNYVEGEDFQAVELPYAGRELSMLVMLPKAGQFDSFGENLDYGKVLSIVESLNAQQVQLTMPKFEFTTGSLGLCELLSDMGMPVAFIRPPARRCNCSTEYANFSGMIGNCGQFLWQVFHKAFVSVDESGTEATAASASVL